MCTLGIILTHSQVPFGPFQLLQLSEISCGRHLQLPRLAASPPSLCACGPCWGVTDKLVVTSNCKHAGLLATCAEQQQQQKQQRLLETTCGRPFPLSLPFSSSLSLSVLLSRLLLCQFVCVCFNYIKLAHVASCT